MSKEDEFDVIKEVKDLVNDPKVIRETRDLVNWLFVEEAQQIRADLRARCEEIPDHVWLRNYPDSRMPLGSHLNSTVSPIELYGYKEIETDLTKEGRIIETLVHYVTDGYDSEKQASDKVLGEASDVRYHEMYQIVITKLDLLKKEAT